MAAYFINADLEILSTHPIDSLRDEIGDRANCLHCGAGRTSPHLAVFEVDDDPETKQPEHLIHRFCDVIESLSAESRCLWTASSERIIDLGYEVNDTHERLAMSVSPHTLARMAALNIILALTVYPPNAQATEEAAVPS